MKRRVCFCFGRGARNVPSPLHPFDPNIFLGITAFLFVILTGIIVTDVVLGADGERESRFTLVLNGAAVEDSKTGLIWEQSPDREFDAWGASLERCQTKDVGGRKGWRAPTIEELKSLIDPTQHDPALPQGHPFSNIKSAIYWAATPVPGDDVVAWQVSFFSGKAQTDQKSLGRRMWCVLAK